METPKHSDHDAALVVAKPMIRPADARGPKIWRASLHTSPQAAVDFANMIPAQEAGEACFSILPDGKVWYFGFW